MNFAQTLEYLYERLPAFARQGKQAVKKDLTNTRRLCAALGNPEQQFRSIHAGGTNGKGSVVAMLGSVLMESGLERVGFYTSPHLLHFSERIRVNSTNVPEAWVVDFVSAHKALIEEVEPSFFELTVAMAFQYFAEQQVDIALVEVGLGGRLDSTNVISPELSIITSIDWDHMDMLGNSLEAIAGEKAGIIKPNTPVVIGQALPETRPVFDEAARQQNADIYYSEQCFQLLLTQNDLHQAVYNVYEGDWQLYEDLAISLPGAYQGANLRTTLMALRVLASILDVDFSEEVVRNGLRRIPQHAGIRGRMELLGREPLVLADVAHNPAGLSAVLEQVTEQAHDDLHLILGLSADKPVEDMLSLLPPYARLYCTQAPLPRAMPAEELAARLRRMGHQAEAYPSASRAIEAALKAAASSDAILISGSVYLISDALRAWDERS